MRSFFFLACTAEQRTRVRQGLLVLPLNLKNTSKHTFCDARVEMLVIQFSGAFSQRDHPSFDTNLPSSTIRQVGDQKKVKWRVALICSPPSVVPH
jgi:hypothetical protein